MCSHCKRDPCLNPEKVCDHHDNYEVSSLFFIKHLLSRPANICKQSALINTKFSKPQCLLVAGSTKTCLYITIYGQMAFLKDLQKLLFIPESQSFRKKNTGAGVSLVKMKTKQRNILVQHVSLLPTTQHLELPWPGWLRTFIIIFVFSWSSLNWTGCRRSVWCSSLLKMSVVWFV